MSSIPTPTDSPVIQPMHNPSQAAVVQQPQAPLGNATNGFLQPAGLGVKAMLAKKLASKGGNPKYVSPTDNMLTPCTAKINQSKKDRFNKGKPIQFMKDTPVTKPSEDDRVSHLSEDARPPHDTNKVDDDENPF